MKRQSNGSVMTARSKPEESEVEVGGEGNGPRIIVRIELTPAAKAAYGRVAERYGRTQISTTSRLMEWFAAQPEGIQAAVLGQYPAELEAEIAKMLLARNGSAAASGKPAAAVAVAVAAK